MNLSRAELLIGKEALAKLAASKVAVFGLGGVGGYAAEALARAGVGSLTLFDGDTVEPTNLNRQLIALGSTIGRSKALAFAERIKDINADCEVTARDVFYMPENASLFPLSEYDAVADCIDRVGAKITLAVNAQEAGVYMVSALGAGNRLDPARFEAADIYATSVCPLARVMRRELKARGIKALRVVYSKEEPLKTGGETIGSLSFVPPVMGMIIASEIVKYLINK